MRLVERTELELDGTVPADQAVARFRERRVRRRRPVREHDAHALLTSRTSDVVQQPEAGVVGVVDVVDGQQQAVGRRREPDELSGSHEQPLMRRAARPRQLCAGQGAVDLLTMAVREPVEQGRVAAAHVSERLDHRRVRPRAFDRRRCAVTDTQVELLRAIGHGRQ